MGANADKEKDERESLREILADMSSVINNFAENDDIPNHDWIDGLVSGTKHWKYRLQRHLRRRGPPR